MIYNYVRFHRISKYFNSIKSRSVRLIAVELSIFIIKEIEPLLEMCSFFITCVEISTNCNFFIEVFIE